jgi:hypothetical protein
MVLESEIAKLNRFADFLRREDKIIFQDMMDQCRLYATFAGTMASPIKAIPLLTCIIFAQHKRIMRLEERINCLPEAKVDQKTEVPSLDFLQ